MCVGNLCLGVHPCPVYFCVLPALAHPHQVREPLLIRWLIGFTCIRAGKQVGDLCINQAYSDSYLGFECLHDVLYFPAFPEWYSPVRSHRVSPSGVSWWFHCCLCGRKVLQKMSAWVQTHTHTNTSYLFFHALIQSLLPKLPFSSLVLPRTYTHIEAEDTIAELFISRPHRVAWQLTTSLRCLATCSLRLLPYIYISK